MKMNTFKILALISVCITGIECFAQSDDYYNENLRRIEAYINGPIKANSCEGGILFPAKYKPSKVKSDLRIMSLVNSLFNAKTVKADIEDGIKTVRKKEIPIKTSVNGLIESNDITMLGTYLNLNVKIDLIDNIIVRSKVTLRTTTHGKCGSHTHLLDFKVIRDFFIRDAKMLFNVGYDEMASDTIYSDNLVALAQKRSDYKFSIPGSSTEEWINKIFAKQYQVDSAGAYDYTKAPRSFVMLIKESRIEVLKDLLYSPNYITSVNAMEAMLYLESIGKLQLSTELNNRITQIKNGSFTIMQQGAPDVLYRREGYKELQMTDEKAIKKYKLSM